MDANRLHEMPESLVARWLLRLLGMRIMPMDEDPDGSMLAEAVRDHVDNEYLDRDMLTVTYRDDQLPSSSTPATLDSQSPFSYARDLEASAAAIYGYTGWFDGAFPRELIHLHMTVRTPGSKLIIGPWGHHAKFNSSPAVEGIQASEFDQAAEIIRFFDYHLKDIDHGIGEEPPIHYYTMGEEKWKEANTWPPPEASNVRYYLSAQNKLSSDEPDTQEDVDIYQVDYTASTGVHSRFGKHLEGGRFPVTYPDRSTRDEELLTYTSAPLNHDMEVTGHPVVTLFASSSAVDGAFIVYLEDVYPDGRVVVATDGCLRACFRKLGDKPPYWVAGPYHTCRKEDAMPLVPGEIAEVTFDLFPVSYLFRAGHSVRLALAGADKDNFVILPPGDPPGVRFYRGGQHASCISLPAVQRS
jgi:putative CocE/NonD family hydrolase